MAVSDDKPAPYASIGSITGILNRYRDRGMTTPFSHDVLARAGVSDSLIPRTLQSLQILDLIDEDGNPTDMLEGLRTAPTADYPQRLAEWLKGVYSDVFAFVDPATDSEVQIRDAFRTYIPTGQQDRMVKLFIGLCEEAGIREKPQKESSPRSRSTTTRKTATKRKPRVDSGTGGTTKQHKNVGDIPSAVAGLINSLPSVDTGWTQQDRDKFIKTFEAVLDFSYPIVTEEELLKKKNDKGEDAENA